MRGGINWVPSEVLYEDKYHAGTDVATAKFETPAGVFLTLRICAEITPLNKMSNARAW